MPKTAERLEAAKTILKRVADIIAAPDKVNQHERIYVYKWERLHALEDEVLAVLAQEKAMEENAELVEPRPVLQNLLFDSIGITPREPEAYEKH